MFRLCVFIIVLITQEIRITNAFGECLNVVTLDGVRTLSHGQKVCAPPRNGENELGIRYLTCIHGSVSITTCHPSLRFDIVTGVCNWPQYASCSTAEILSTTAQRPAITTQKRQSTTTPKPAITTTQKAQTVRNQSPEISTSGLCSANNCRLPKCFCSGSQPNLPVSDTPQFLMLTFDDAVTPQLYENYFKSLLVDNAYRIFNPSGCTIRSAFYVSHENTDYSKVLRLWQSGHEIASHTIHHNLPTGDSQKDYPEMAAEIDGLRQEVFKALGNKTLVDSINGFRAPYLRVAHDVQYDVLRDYNFLYDTSVTSVELWTGQTPLWPFTLDYVIKRCNNPPCPTKSYPGLWEVVMNAWMGENGFPCSMVDTCSLASGTLDTANQAAWEALYNKNFALFNKAKTPIPFFTHGSMFLRSPSSYTALVSWLKSLQTERSDVWVVTPQQVIQWMKNPMTNNEMKAQRWGC
uniref:Chitin-binding type-2 domain-containing protein n=1 Tax=Biomphalaria glabrata TaxID=6526 RepID=A0A2C9LA65_BIOGL